MGASSTGLKSNRVQEEDDQRVHQQVMVPRFSFEDVENNNNHIYINPQTNELNFLPIHALIDELNNNTTLINNNYLTVSLTSPSSTTVTTSYNKFNKKQALYRLPEKQIRSDNNRKDKMPKESPKKKKLDEKLLKEKKKKKKEKPKPPRAPAGGAGGPGGGGRGRGVAEQDQMMRRPRRKNNSKEK